MNVSVLYESQFAWTLFLVLGALAGLALVQWQEKVVRRGRQRPVASEQGQRRR